VIGAAVIVAASPADLAVFLPADIYGFPYRLSFNEPLLLLLRGFLGFSLLRHHWPPLKVKEGKHEVRPYCDGLFNRRNDPQRIEFLRLSTPGASGLEEKLAINMSQPEKIFQEDYT